MALLALSSSNTGNFNSFITLEVADEFHEARATPSWLDADTDAREAALIKASDYIDAYYTFDPSPFMGDGLHPALVKATAIMAANALMESFDGRATRDVVEDEQELSGVGKKRRKFDDKPVSDPFPMVTAILAPLTRQTSASVFVGKVIK